jgi:glycerate kinase
VGIDAVLPIAPGPISLVEAMARGAELLADAAERAMRLARLRLG